MRNNEQRHLDLHISLIYYNLTSFSLSHEANYYCPEHTAGKSEAQMLSEVVCWRLDTY